MFVIICLITLLIVTDTSVFSDWIQDKGGHSSCLESSYFE